VQELESYKNYSFRVQTCTRDGTPESCSPLSQPVFVRTLMSEPGQMTRPWAKFQNKSTIMVFWDPPAEPNGPIAFYELNVTVVSSSGVVSSQMTNHTRKDDLQTEVCKEIVSNLVLISLVLFTSQMDHRFTLFECSTIKLRDELVVIS
jgi:hypothetical protein